MNPDNRPQASTPVGKAALRELTDRTVAMLAAVVIGATVGALAYGFFTIVMAASAYWGTPLPGSVSWSAATWNPAVAIALIGAALIAGQLLRILPGHRPHGPADLIEAAQQDRHPGVKAGLLSSLLALVSLSGGATTGIFGPLVHLGGCLSSALKGLCRRVPVDVLLGIGAGAAVAAVFSAPIGAAIFAHEAIVRRFSVYGPAPVLIGSFSAYWVASTLLDQPPLFGVVSSTPNLDVQTLTLAVALGAITAVVSVVYVLMVTETPRLAARLPVPLSLRPMIPALLLLGLSPWLPHLLGPGLGSVDLALAGGLALGLTMLLLVLKITMTSVCLAFGFYGGVFAPALFIGAMVGALFDGLFGAAGGGSTFAILGAASCIAAVIGAPIASIVIIFELTGSYAWAVLSMLSVVTCSQIARAIVGRSLFDRQLALRGVRVDDDHPPTIPVPTQSSAMRKGN